MKKTKLNLSIKWFKRIQSFALTRNGQNYEKFFFFNVPYVLFVLFYFKNAQAVCKASGPVIKVARQPDSRAIFFLTHLRFITFHEKTRSWADSVFSLDHIAIEGNNFILLLYFFRFFFFFGQVTLTLFFSLVSWDEVCLVICHEWISLVISETFIYIFVPSICVDKVNYPWPRIKFKKSLLTFSTDLFSLFCSIVNYLN